MLMSPGVEIKEKDMTLVVSNVSSTTGGVAGRFKNGPISVPYLITTEADLASVFGPPDDGNFPEWFAAAEFLKYSGALYVVRAAASDTTTSVAKAGAVPTIVLKSQDDFEDKLSQSSEYANGTYGMWASRLPGQIGNSLAVIAVDAGNWEQFTAWSTTNTSKYGVNLSTLFSQPPRTSAWLQDKLVNGHGATFTVNTSNGSVSGVSIANGGSGYKSGAYLEFNGAGTGAAANLTINDGVLTKITLTNAGTGYVSAPTILISPPSAGGNIATATCTVSANKITSITLTSGGSGYTAADLETLTIQFNGVTNVGQAIIPQDGISDGVITAVTGLVGGIGYGTGTVSAAAFNKSVDDEMHVLVVDTGGQVSGVVGKVLESYEGLSKVTNSLNAFGTDNYYMTVINNSSKYIYNLKPPSVGNLVNDLVSDGTYVPWDVRTSDTILSSGKTLIEYFNDVGGSFRPFKSISTPIELVGGSDGTTVNDGQIKDGYSLLANVDQYDIACFPTAGFSVDVIKHVIENVAYGRRDAMAFVSPYSVSASDLANNKYVLLKTASDLVNFKNIDIAVSDMYAQYAVMDTGWKYIFDKYNNKYRWVPLNGDTAGVVARLELVAEPWFSPGGYDRGGIKNVLKLSYNPVQAERDAVYPKGINPVVVLPAGGGVMLFGDRTMTSKPSAFDRINVRRLFNILEKAVGKMARYKLFEINDSFTRTDFKSKVDSYLRDIQGRRGITEYLVVCDSTNNTGDIIDKNEFRADIYIKPTRSINFITLSFVATSTGVAFSTVVGA